MNRKIILLIILVLAGVGAYFAFFSNSDDQIEETQTQSQEPTQQQSTEKVYKTLTGDEYKTLFLDSSHPNTKVIVNGPSITGDEAADKVIAELAEARGYVLQEVPSQDLNDYDGLLMQEKLYNAWLELEKSAAEAGHILGIESAYRSIEDQVALFRDALSAAGVANSQIVSRQADSSLNEIMRITAPPGYSRHHTGYVVDISDASTPVFEYSAGFDWLSKDNYLNAKKHGFIPSYPDGAQNQGPDPEAWEYVWVGEPLLLE